MWLWVLLCCFVLVGGEFMVVFGDVVVDFLIKIVMCGGMCVYLMLMEWWMFEYLFWYFGVLVIC